MYKENENIHAEIWSYTIIGLLRESASPRPLGHAGTE